MTTTAPTSPPLRAASTSSSAAQPPPASEVAPPVNPVSEARAVSDVSEAIDAARATARAAAVLAHSAHESVRAASTAVRHQVAQRPYLTLGVAAGVGFIVAGGLASPAMSGLLRAAGKLAVAAATRKIGEALLDAAADKSPATST